MANPTTNYGFVLPTSTDLVTDLPADFDVALQGVDTRLKALQPGTTSGDLAYSSATANTNVRLGIGTAGQVLGIAAGVPAWTTPAGGGGMTLLSTTTLSGASTTVSSISGAYKDLMIEISGLTLAAQSYGVHFDPNGSTSIASAASVGATNAFVETDAFNNSTIWANRTGDFGTSANTAFNFTIYNYASAQAVKNFSAIMRWELGGDKKTKFMGGGISTASAITSWKVATDASTFTAGTIKVYGVN